MIRRSLLTIETKLGLRATYSSAPAAAAAVSTVAGRYGRAGVGNHSNGWQAQLVQGCVCEKIANIACAVIQPAPNWCHHSPYRHTCLGMTLLVRSLF